MAHFSNGTEGLAYEEQWCFKCQHGQAEEGCVVWNAHFYFCQELCNEAGAPGRHILDMLIPVDTARWPQKCSMFIKNISKDKMRSARLKEQATQYMRDGRMTEAIKLYNQAWDMERTQGDG